MKEIIDQILHFGWAFGALAPVLVRPCVWTAMLSALFIGLPRELVDQWNGWPIGWGKLLDIGSFVLGGFAAGILLVKSWHLSKMKERKL